METFFEIGRKQVLAESNEKSLWSGESLDWDTYLPSGGESSLELRERVAGERMIEVLKVNEDGGVESGSNSTPSRREESLVSNKKKSEAIALNEKPQVKIKRTKDTHKNKNDETVSQVRLIVEPLDTSKDISSTAAKMPSKFLNVASPATPK